MNVDVDEIETVTTIIETCPEFLATKDNFGSLPCHWAAYNYDTASRTTYLPLFADIGRRHNIGCEGTRGGLLVQNNCQHNALQALSLSCSSGDTIKAMMTTYEPPLFFVEDVCNHELIHFAVNSQCLENVKFFVDLYPSCV